MKLKLDIRSEIEIVKTGWFSSKKVPIHVLYIYLQLSEREKNIIRDANMLDEYFTAEEYTGVDPEIMRQNFPETGGRLPVTYDALINRHKTRIRFLTLPGAQKALEETKQGMAQLKVLLEQRNDPSSTSL